ncbi:MAG TPA: GH92 family glycosyl hydrolase [Candidatus Sulfotelmatobacter sp.]|nr:GH92 family glycosyl hydrolase [Candidatus Sulfotelmatobacter sp.]
MKTPHSIWKQFIRLQPTLQIIAAIVAASPVVAIASMNPVDESLPMVGTDAHGHAYPGATVPFGMVQVSPDTRTEGWDGCSGYHYSDSVIEGFSHTHLSGTGAGCLGDVLLMPTVGDVDLRAGSPGAGYASKFSHAQETASPGYYRVFLETPAVTAELTASARCGFHKYTFPASDQSHIILDLTHGIGNRAAEAALHIEDDHTISGYRISDGWGGRRAIYFVIQFSKPFDSFGIEQDGQRLAPATHDAQGQFVKAFFNYKTAAGETVLVKVGISGTGIDGARKNLAAEIPGWDFNGVRADAVRQWKKVFDAIQVKTFDPHIERAFYANLYLTALAPVLFNDVDGSYRGYDHENHPNPGFQNYTTISIWDIYRTEWPLLTLMQPARADDMVRAMLLEYPQLGQHTTPIWPLWGNETWCMIGYHSVDMITEAYLEGFHDFDAEKAYEQMRDTALQDRDGLDRYKTLGYVPSTPGGTATSRTLEYAFDDWCIAQMASALGHQDDARTFYQRAANYRNLFDQTTDFFRGRLANGAWRRPFIPNGMVNDEFTEADAWQYAFAVQQDVPGMISLYGGDDGFIQKMDTLFTTNSTIETGLPDLSGRIGQYVGGNEQSVHIAYLYDYAGAPSKTQYWVRQAMSQLYNDTPTGEPGNIDCGEMAAWYVFSALGVYPVNPDSGIYAIGSPAVTEAVIHLDRGKYHGREFTVIADNNSEKNIYVQSVTLNGKPLNHPWITRDDVISGGALHFVMGPQPNPDWGSALADRPPATMPAGIQYPRLPAPAPTNQIVHWSLPIQVVCGSDDPVAGFLPDPDMDEGEENSADVTVDTTASNAAPAAVYDSERYGNDFTYVFPVPRGQRYLVRLHFAEIFDNDAGSRLENIYINRRPVLSNFDIYAAAGGMNKAVVKEFHVRPSRRGTIAIRIMAPPNSPDQNAKISAIEILKDDSTAAPFVFQTDNGNCAIAIDTSAAPELTDWAQHKLAPVLATWYPKIVAMLPSDGFTAPAAYTITVQPMDGVAYTTGTNVFVSEQWCNDQMNGQAIGSLVHESVHVVQQYHFDVPSWLVEGMADYVRWFKYEPQSHGADIIWMRGQGGNFSPNYDGSYRISANFLNWLTEKYDTNIVTEVDAVARDGKYTDDFWQQRTGKTLNELGAEWKNQIETQLRE